MILEPKEVIALVQIVHALPEGVMVMNDKDELCMLERLPEVETLVGKLAKELERPDVRVLIP